jgi:hypothetical protein
MGAHQVTIRRCFWQFNLRSTAKRLRKLLIVRGVEPRMGWASGDLSIEVNGSLVYSFKDEKRLLDDKALISRVRAKVWETRSF